MVGRPHIQRNQSPSPHGTCQRPGASPWPDVLWQLDVQGEHGIRHSNEVLRSLHKAPWSLSLCILEDAMKRDLEPTEFTSSLLMNQLRLGGSLLAAGYDVG